ncbi:hypothetical protein LINGRAHAP2_LOCUS10925 [Linum grandiflorum]
MSLMIRHVLVLMKLEKKMFHLWADGSHSSGNHSRK